MVSGSGSGSGRREQPGRESKEWAAAARLLGVSSVDLKGFNKLRNRMNLAEITKLVEEKLAAEEKKSAEVIPSDLCTRVAERKVQFESVGGPRFICYKGPPEARPAVPLLLAYKGYLNFRHNAESMVAEAQDMKVAQELMSLCTIGWEDEVSEMTPDLNLLFGKYLKRRIHQTSVGKTGSDGLVDGSFLLFEHKLMTFEGFLQGLEYLRALFERERELGLPGSCGMLVMVVRPYIQFVAAAMDWKLRKVVAEPLTPLLNCFGVERHELKVLASALRALRLFWQEYDQTVEVDPSVPYVFGGKPVQQLKKSLAFHVVPDMVVKKLTMNYSERAHKLWADKGVAPALHGVTEIGAGWHVVEMAWLGDGWLDAKDVLVGLSGQKDRIDTLTECIKAAADKGHSTGFVHGDMRLPNIKVHPTADGRFQVMFVDFDWSGKAGEVTYPVLLNPDIEWHSDAEYGKPILKEHDLHFVNDLAAQLKKKELK